MRECTKKEMIEIIHESIMDELADAAYYHKLANIAPDNEARTIILSIAADEERHAKELMEMHASLCGCAKYKNPTPPSPAVGDYKHALDHRFHEEVKAYKKYKEYYLCSCNIRLRDMWFDIMHDENRHAMYMLYLMQKYCCSMMEKHMKEHEHHCPGHNDHMPNPGYPGCGKANGGAANYFSPEMLIETE